MQGHDRGWIIGRRVGMDEAAGQRAAVPNLRVADGPRRVRQQRPCAVHARMRRHLGVPRQRAYRQAAVLFDNGGQTGDAVEVDDRAWLGQAQLEQRHQALAAGQEFRVRAVRVQQPQHLFYFGRCEVVLDDVGIHALPPRRCLTNRGGKSRKRARGHPGCHSLLKPAPDHIRTPSVFERIPPDSSLHPSEFSTSGRREWFLRDEPELPSSVHPDASKTRDSLCAALSRTLLFSVVAPRPPRSVAVFSSYGDSLNAHQIQRFRDVQALNLDPELNRFSHAFQ